MSQKKKTSECVTKKKTDEDDSGFLNFEEFHQGMQKMGFNEQQVFYTGLPPYMVPPYMVPPYMVPPYMIPPHLLPPYMVPRLKHPN